MIVGMAVAKPLLTIGRTVVKRFPGESAFFFVSRMTIDADGASRAYHKSGSPPGLDLLANAGHPGNWWGIATRNGQPVVQRRSDPAPGFYVSLTALVYRDSRGSTDPRHYVDAATVPYIALSPRVLRAAHAHLGDVAVVWNRRTDKLAHAIVADLGPVDELGEGSIALARATGIPASPTSGGQLGDVVYLVFPDSGNRYARPVPIINRLAAKLLRQWGGIERLKKIRD
jgi:hypothetical protein